MTGIVTERGCWVEVASEPAAEIEAGPRTEQAPWPLRDFFAVRGGVAPSGRVGCGN